ncbi:MAG TPA: 1,2-phenylacetyl-CoA epoxidase subunit PaaD [Acidimicrobiia bacterium]|nr:1,2-phenylacetyl-CoA epoxidase subunit PaaD [Acidimicrobiia bacterium]
MNPVIASDLRRIVGAVEDPELPFVTIEELGILRDLEVEDDGRVTVTVTPTYSGCPATEVIRDAVLGALSGAGYGDARVRTVFSPPWTTDDISTEGRRKLDRAGIAPPRDLSQVLDLPVLCPLCRDSATHIVSEFGSTACKALMVCDSCGEPFDHFKEL